MQPNDNKQIYSADYLEQIAPQSNKYTKALNIKNVLIFAIISFVIIILAFIFNMISSSSRPIEQLATSILSIENITSSATPNIKSSQLRAINGNLKVYLTGVIRDIKPLLSEEKINIDKLNSTIAKIESNINLLNKLEDARLNALYDRTYAREISYQLDKLLTIMSQIQNMNNSKKITDFVSNAKTELTPIQKQFAEFNLATS